MAIAQAIVAWGYGLRQINILYKTAAIIYGRQN